MGNKPIGIWICTILFAIGGLLSILGGLVILWVGGAMFGIGDFGVRDSYMEYAGVWMEWLAGIISILAAIIIIIGVVYLAVAYGIWKVKKWARIAGIILAIIGGVIGFPIGTIIALIILYFLLIDKDTKSLFTG